MANPTPGTQLDRVLNLMQDGQWRSPAEIAQATGDGEHSVTSRIRDLRLPLYGGHQVESRKRNVTRQIWEYRLTSSTTAPAQSNLSVGAFPTTPAPMSASHIWPVSGDPVSTGATAVAPAVATSSPPVKFLNMDTMMVEQISRDMCQVDTSHGFNRVVAVDASGHVLSNLVTTQSDL